MPRVVLDTNVLVSALITPAGSSAQLLLKLRDGEFEAIVSALLLSELSDVLKRPKFRRYVSEREVDEYVELVRRAGVAVDDPQPSGEPLTTDPGDQFILDLARAAHADAIVSGDPHLLDLRPRVSVHSPREFLESLGT